MEESSHTFFRSKNTEMFDVLKKQIKKNTGWCSQQYPTFSLPFNDFYILFAWHVNDKNC